MFAEFLRVVRKRMHKHYVGKIKVFHFIPAEKTVLHLFGIFHYILRVVGGMLVNVVCNIHIRHVTEFNGVHAAKGLFYKVVDSDDWLEKGALLKLLENIKAHIEFGNVPDMYITAVLILIDCPSLPIK